MKPIKCIPVEWHEEHPDGDLDDYLWCSESHYVPVDLFNQQTGSDKEKLEKAFREHTGKDPKHIIDWVADRFFDQEGTHWNKVDEKMFLLGIFEPYKHLIDGELIYSINGAGGVNVHIWSENVLILFAKIYDGTLIVSLIEHFRNEDGDEVEKVMIDEEWTLSDPSSLQRFHELFKKVLKTYFRDTAYFLARERKRYEKLCGDV